MAEIHVATSGPLVKDLVLAVLEEFDVWAGHAPNQAAALWPNDPIRAADSALYDVRCELAEHVQIRLSIALATHGVPS